LHNFAGISRRKFLEKEVRIEDNIKVRMSIYLRGSKL